jgi:hypothetical protein
LEAIEPKRQISIASGAIVFGLSAGNPPRR